MAKHGAPDWYMYRRRSVTFPMADMAELAARLGSPVKYDRRGDVIYMETFESGVIHAKTFTSGTGAAVEVSPASSRSGAYSAKLTAGSTMIKNAQIAIGFAPLRAERIGLECSWSRVPDDVHIELQISLYDGTTSHRARIRYSSDLAKFQFYDENQAWQDLETGLSLYHDAYYYHTMKVVADLETDYFARALLDNYEHDLSDYPLWTFADSGGPFLHGIITLTDTETANPFIYVDDVIVTQDEP